MAIYTSMKIVLGHAFEPGENVPDVGSLELDQEWNIIGKVVDASKLNDVTWLKPGTSALLTDGSGNNKVYVFTDNTWKGLN